MTIEDLKETLKEYGWTQAGVMWVKDRRVFNVSNSGLVCYQGGVSVTAYVEYIFLGYGTDVLEICLEDETVEVSL